MPPSLRRSDILADRTLAGRAFCRSYTALVDDWLIALFDHAVDRAAVDGQGIALVAVGGQGRGELAPQSDLDLLLVYDRGVDDVAAVADALWYPIWDEGLKLGHAVRTVRDTLTLAAEDLETATALLSARHLAGDRLLSDELIEKSRSAWRRRGRRWLEVLSRSVSDRHHSAGEVAFDLEPDLKDGRGGLRDVHALQWAVAAGAEIDPATAASLAEHHDTLLAVRVELHRISPKPGDRLMLSDQDEVAARTGDADADALMARVAAAGRSIAWVSDESWDYIDLRSGGGLKDRLRRERHLEGGVVVRNGRVALADNSASQEDPSALFHLALGAARSARRIDPAALGLLASTPAMAEPWPAEARRLFVELLLNGPASIPVIETLDQVGLWERLLPEWAAVRSLPQRNVFHRYTVDRHLLECSAEAASVSHRTPRPDLLVVGALLHDIAKGLPGDHSEVGARMAGAIATRMGFDDGDADTIAFLARHHLLLSDVATRRDLDDPATVQMVVDVVRTPERLALLRALSEADGLSTGPTVWGPWKAQLVDQLATRVAQALIGDSPRPGENGGFPSESQRELMCAGGLQVRARGRPADGRRSGPARAVLPDRGCAVAARVGRDGGERVVRGRCRPGRVPGGPRRIRCRPLGHRRTGHRPGARRTSRHPGAPGREGAIGAAPGGSRGQPVPAQGALRQRHRVLRDGARGGGTRPVRSAARTHPGAGRHGPGRVVGEDPHHGRRRRRHLLRDRRRRAEGHRRRAPGRDPSSSHARAGSERVSFLR
ncbi:MAG: HD domain-containing protein [Microthrixaceae bacterium]